MAQRNAPSIALSVLDSIRTAEGLATEVIRREASRLGLDPAITSRVTHLVMGVLRKRAVLDLVIDGASKRGAPLGDSRLMDILRLGALELLFSNKVNISGAVHSYVELAKRTKGPRVGGFVNAVLRKVSQVSQPELDSLLESRLDGCLFPTWLNEELKRSYGEEGWVRERELLESPSKIWLRTNGWKSTVEKLHEELGRWGIEASRDERLPQGLVLPPDSPPYATLPFHEGWFWPQDGASQLVAELASLAPAGDWLDACSGSGTKSLVLSSPAFSESRVWSSDLNWLKLRSHSNRAQQLDAPPTQPVCADLRRPPFPPQSFSFVLLDAPCTGLGTIRRHPELAWRRTRKDAQSNRETQLALLESCFELLAPGGTLVYAVCSFLPLEGFEVIRQFLASHRLAVPHDSLVAFLEKRDFLITPAVEEGLKLGGFAPPPSWLDSDAFFIAVLERKAS